MHVTQVIGNLELGGAQLSLLRLVGALARDGVVCNVLAGTATEAALRLFRRHDVDVEVWNGAPNLQYALEPAFGDWLAPRLVGADAVHARMTGAWWAAAHAISDDVPLLASEHNALQWPDGVPDAMLASALPRVDRFFVHGPAARRQIAALGIAVERLRRGVSPIQQPARAARPELPRKRVVFAGRMHREKGPDVLLEALALMTDPPACYMLGDGPLMAALRRRARRRDLRRVVRFCGWQADPGTWIAGAGACVVPSRFDAWSQTGVLAMALGTPVVASAVEGLPATLAHRRGRLVAPDDPAALAGALTEILAGRHGIDLAAGRRYAMRFTPRRVARAYLRDYRELASAGLAWRRAEPMSPIDSNRTGGR
jgi:glycosyltransferase involved in cell wall biosynthesis